MNTPKEDKKWSVVHEAIEQQDNMKPVKLKDKGYTKEKEGKQLPSKPNL